MTGSSSLADQVESLLRRWGHTVARSGSQGEFKAAASHRLTDTVVVVCDGEGFEGCCPATLQPAGESAPMLLVGRAGRGCGRAEAFLERVAEPGRGGRRLARALRYCLERAAQMRRHAAEVKVYHEYIQFLSHEIRTPITSALSALEILDAEFALRGLDEDRRGDFVRIALRNLKRLRESVNWTEDYLATRSGSLSPRWRESRVGELFTQASGFAASRPDLALVLEGGIESAPMVSDVDLLRALLQQVLHALAHLAPGTRLKLRLALRPDAGAPAPALGGLERTAEVVASLHLVGPDGQTAAPRLSRAGLVERGEGPDLELTRLLEFTVSREVLCLLGARITVPSRTAQGGPILVLSLPVVPPASVAAPACATAPTKLS